MILFHLEKETWLNIRNKKYLEYIHKDDFFDIQSSKQLIAIINDAKESTRIECNKCDIHDICGGGCYRHVLSNGKNAFCETFKVLYPYIKHVVNSTKAQ